MNLRRMRHRLRKSLAERGAVATISRLLKKGSQVRPRSPGQAKEYTPVHPFDQQFGVETSGLLFAEELSSKDPHRDLYNSGYFGVAPSAFRQAVDRLRLEFANYTFVDLGSGKGRAMLIASEYPFRAIIGVELSPRLHAVAVDNFTRYTGQNQRCRHLTSIEGDATEYVFPAGPLLIYLWNPFEGPVFASVLANLEASLAREPRDIFILYIQPNHEEQLEASSHWRKLWHDDFEMSDEDYAACAFPTRAEPCSAYCSVLCSSTPLKIGRAK